MTLQNRSVFVGKLITIGRRTGLPRTVEIRLVYLDGKFYVCSSNIQRKHWCQNMTKNPNVEVQAGGKHFSCRAQLVTEGELHLSILHLRDSTALLDRAVFEIGQENTLHLCSNSSTVTVQSVGITWASLTALIAGGQRQSFPERSSSKMPGRLMGSAGVHCWVAIAYVPFAFA